MYSINFKPRKYQEEISKTSNNYNSLLVLPTGTGKTPTAIITAIKRLNENKDTQILALTPTKPLSSQIQQEFIEKTNIPKEKITLLTGAIVPKKRKDLFENSTVIVATPQTIEKDLINKRINMGNVSLLIIDEAHRSRENYANTKVAKNYIENSKCPRILALTASPGSTKAKIEEIKENLFIENIEIRTEEDLKEYIQEKNIKWFEIELQDDLKKLLKLIKTPYQEKLKELKKIGFTKPTNIINKRDLLILQNTYRNKNSKSYSDYYSISLIALLLKLDYASELLETQGLNPLKTFLNKLQNEETKAAKNIINLPNIKKAISLTEELINKDLKHPKLYALKGIIKKEFQKNNNSKIMIFANYRNTIEELLREITDIEYVKATKLIGQKQGLKQKEQIETIKNFEQNKFNILICSSIGEEGISLSADTVIFYDLVASEIRSIQRRGRVGRTKAGKIIFLVTNDTREQGYRWASIQKERKMKSTLKKMQEKTLKGF